MPAPAQGPRNEKRLLMFVPHAWPGLAKIMPSMLRAGVFFMPRPGLEKPGPTDRSRTPMWQSTFAQKDPMVHANVGVRRMRTGKFSNHKIFHKKYHVSCVDRKNLKINFLFSPMQIDYRSLCTDTHVSTRFLVDISTCASRK